ncbi:MAG TPA: DNA mismatch repair protein MutS [Terriglobia bacterium]|nr:DNA mismatch repair protein MutS [Terriglobia bacterium]
MTEFSTPLMSQYSAIKARHPNALLLFRLGDFYELFFEDAVLAARELQITLTSRNKEKGEPIPMCGVPYHAAEGYIARLIRKGYRVAICDQMEDARVAKKLVKREVTRVVTPGTSIDSQVLEPRANNYLAAVAARHGAAGLAFADLSTGDFRATEFSGPDANLRLDEELARLAPSELLMPAGKPESGLRSLTVPPADGARGRHVAPGAYPSASAADGFSRMQNLRAELPALTVTPLDDWVFSEDYGGRVLRDHFRVASLAGYGLEGRPLALAAAGAILHYVRDTQRGSLAHLDSLRFFEQQDALILDPSTLRNLELVEPIFPGAAGLAPGGSSRDSTLLWTLDECVTPLGARQLKNWMLRPSIERAEMEARWEAVGELLREAIAREELRKSLGRIQDLERLLSKVTLETANARDLLALKLSLAQLPRVRVQVSAFAAPRLVDLHDRLDELADVSELLEASIHPEPPALLTEGNLIRPGYHAALDELRGISQSSKQLIAAIEARERERTRIGSLKVRFNNVFGYYLEVSRPNLPLVPPDYERKQTLVNAERFTTPELKELEAKILSAEDRAQTLELELFREIRRRVAAEAPRIRRTAQALAEIDVLACFAALAAERNYRRPEISENGDLEILQGRHPVIERLVFPGESGGFIPNDLYLNTDSDRILIITGPNMGGKSTYLRQAALIAIMAQMGAFVPAERARLPILDRIFTRIGASDNLARGRSTFMVEMTEAASILNTATARSLVLLDEIGRGTATFDGLAIAWAVVEHLEARTRARTLFATHYHELTELAELLPGVRNYHVSVKESGANIIFLRKVEPGAADKSYGVEVARLAGLPPAVIERAREILARHEQSEHNLSERLAAEAPAGGARPASSRERPPVQLTIFTPLNAEVVRALEEADLDNMKPIEALNLLAELKKQIQ